MHVPDPSFRAVRFTAGYHPKDVDAFLAEALPQLRSGRIDAGLDQRIRAVTFRRTGTREGYPQNEVDTYLDVLLAAAREHAERRRADPEGRGEGASVPAPGIAPAAPRFTVTRWREGYDRAEVDALVDEVRTALERGPVPVGLPERVAGAMFQPSRMHPGYDQEQVDTYLDLLVEAARAAVRHAQAVPLGPDEAAAQARALAAPGQGPDGVRFARADAASSGYRITEVDELARRVARELDSPAPSLTAAEVTAARPGRQRAGYRTDLVDAWLADVAGHLARRPPP